MQTVWPDSCVEDANLTVSISILRKALGAKEGDLRHIETIPKKGYRFTASVKEVTSSPEDLSSPDKKTPKQSTIATPPSNAASVTAVTVPQPVDEERSRGGIRDGPALILDKVARPASRRWMTILGLALLACILMARGYVVYRKTNWPHSVRRHHTAVWRFSRSGISARTQMTTSCAFRSPMQ